MQEGGKIAVAVSVTFLTGVVAGWLLNTYTRKVGVVGAECGSSSITWPSSWGVPGISCRARIVRAQPPSTTEP
jgi:hypothetical protein